MPPAPGLREAPGRWPKPKPRAIRTDADGNVVPDLRAAAAIIYDPATGKVLWEENSQDERSIASITKVMTAIVFLESATDLNQEVQIVRADTLRASTTYLRTNDRVRVTDLLHLLLMPSDNAAARALARVSPLGYDGFIARMNQKAEDLGLDHTHYVDPSGLYADNISSAYDMARLISYAAPKTTASGRSCGHRSIRSARSAANRRAASSPSAAPTRFFARATSMCVGGKTGFISKAGYCLATLLKLPRADLRSRSSCLAPTRTRAASGKRVTCWRGSPSAPHHRPYHPRRRPQPSKPSSAHRRKDAREALWKKDPRVSAPLRLCVETEPFRLCSRAGWRRRRAAAWRWSRRPASPAGCRRGRRTLSDTDGIRRTRRCGSAGRGW